MLVKVPVPQIRLPGVYSCLSSRLQLPAIGRQQWWLKLLGSWQPCGRPGLASCSQLGLWGHCRSSGTEPAHGGLPRTPLPPPILLPLKLVTKNLNVCICWTSSLSENSSRYFLCHYCINYTNTVHFLKFQKFICLSYSQQHHLFFQNIINNLNSYIWDIAWTNCGFPTHGGIKK